MLAALQGEQGAAGERRPRLGQVGDRTQLDRQRVGRSGCAPEAAHRGDGAGIERQQPVGRECCRCLAAQAQRGARAEGHRSGGQAQRAAGWLQPQQPALEGRVGGETAERHLQVHPPAGRGASQQQREVRGQRRARVARRSKGHAHPAGRAGQLEARGTGEEASVNRPAGRPVQREDNPVAALADRERARRCRLGEAERGRHARGGGPGQPERGTARDRLPEPAGRARTRIGHRRAESITVDQGSRHRRPPTARNN